MLATVNIYKFQRAKFIKNIFLLFLLSVAEMVVVAMEFL